MSTSVPGRQPPGRQPPGRQPPEQQPPPELTVSDDRWGRVDRKRERIRAEIERNRAGDHKVPTWALAAILGLVLAAWLLLMVAA